MLASALLPLLLLSGARNDVAVAHSTASKVGAHHLLDLAHSRELGDQRQVGFLRLLAVRSECLDSHIETNLVSVFEAVCDGLLGRVDPHGHLVETDWTPTLKDGSEYQNTRSGMLPSFVGVTGKRNIRRVRKLDRKTTMGECRGQADDSPRDSEGHLPEPDADALSNVTQGYGWAKRRCSDNA